MSGDDDNTYDLLHSRQELSRRAALKLLATTLAATQVGCMKAPGDAILPYSQLPAGMVPGTPEQYATSMVMDGFAVGLLVEAYEGRPTKVEGNPAHPASLGATTAQHQASVLDVYDPQRLKGVVERGLPSSWEQLLSRLSPLPEGPLWLVLPPQSSPLSADLLAQLRQRKPDTHVVYHAALDHGAAYRGASLVFGRPLEVQLDLTRAAVVVSLDADILASMPMSVRWSRDFALRRRVARASDEPIRLYVVEPMMTPTGTLADHRLARPASDVTTLAVCMLEELRRRGVSAPLLSATAVASAARLMQEPACQSFVRKAVDDLLRQRGAGAVVVSDRQPAACHALAHVLNTVLGNLGGPVSLSEPVLLDAALPGETLTDLMAALKARQVATLALIDVNPVYTSSLGHELGPLLGEAPLSVHFTLYKNETSRVCKLVAPLSHYLESWGEARAWDGTLSFTQPLTRPLHDSRSLIEVLAMFAGRQVSSPRELLRESWREPLAAGQGFEARFALALAKGVLEGSALPRLSLPVAIGPGFTAAVDAGLATADDRGFELAVAPSPSILDGSFSSNSWLQELPHPITKLTWGNAAMLSPHTAAELGVEDGDVVSLRVGTRKLEAPALIVRGHADRSVTLELGYGRRAPDEPVSDGLGASAYRLLPPDGSAIVRGLALAKSGRKTKLARTQLHFDDQGAGMARHATLAAYREQASHPEKHTEHLPTLLQEQPKTAPQWAMTIDTTICTGCSSCVVACQAENNVPVVGREGVLKNREMHWLRIDSYHYASSTEERVEIVHQPMLCQHCEHAPCEYVCPVFATSHSPDGLNEMTYNRCIGTRFCSNNCPYKVRRFNWFDYTSGTDTRALQRNPDVSVRDRGVMEKCTYCVQRIRGAEQRARIEKRAIRQGEVVTACQQACPTGAIQFGALEHKDTDMVRWRQEPRCYSVLDELGTRPRTQYLAKVTNPHSDPGGWRMNESLLLGTPSHAEINQKLLETTWKGDKRFFRIGFLISGALTLLLIFAASYTVGMGIGVWGNNIPVAWAFGIINFVWWIGIGHAGTFISAILYLLEQGWRNSISRFAEAMTLFAVAQAALFPVLHLGRPWFAYWLFPYPSTMGTWPNTRSALPWDAAAISTYGLVSLMFWYLGLVPDLASLRDHAPTRTRRIVYGLMAFGWRGDWRAWRHYRAAYLLLAGIATPLVVSVHSIVSSDFASALPPGWHSTIFPPFFVAGAIYSGFAMVLTLVIPVRVLFNMREVITLKHLENCAKLLLVTGMLVSYGYAVEFFIAWYSAEHSEVYQFFVARPFGPNRTIFWLMIVCNVLTPQLFWMKRMRTSIPVLFVTSLLINLGMWCERFVIVVMSLQRNHIPSGWGAYSPTWVDLSILLGTMGFFSLLFLAFLRFLPFVSVSEIKELKHELEHHGAHP